MYHLMKSEKFTLEHSASGRMSLYRQTEIGHYDKLTAARKACEFANSNGNPRCYVVNESGQEYYEGTWID